MTVFQVPQNVYNAVAPVAREYNVPDPVWETVAYAESGFNPQAEGDFRNGMPTSFGLFQLHEGGQLPASYYNNPQAVYDPGLNARLAMPAISRAWQAGQPAAPTSLAWWENFGSVSGHPGGTPGDSVNRAEAANLLRAYPSFSDGSAAPVQLLGSSSGGDCCAGDFWCHVCMNMTGAIGNPGTICCPGVAGAGVQGTAQGIGAQIAAILGGWLQGTIGTLKQEAIKVGVFVLGLVLFILAWWILLRGGNA